MSETILDFPLDLWREVINYLTQYDILQMLRVCKLWKENISQIILRWESPKGTTSLAFICSTFPNLEYLLCRASVIDDFAHFHNLQNLRHLDLNYISDFRQNNTIRYLASLATLETLRINYPFTPETITYLTNLQKLHTICFEGSSLLEIKE